MPIRLRILLAMIPALTAGIRAQAPADDPFSRQGICAFAAHLESQGDAAAAAELARCLFLTEAADSAVNPDLRNRLVQSRIRAGELEPAYREFGSWSAADSGVPLRETAFNLGRELLRADRDSLIPPLVRGLRGNGEGVAQARLRLLQASAWLRLGKPDSAGAALRLATREGGKDAEASAALLAGLAREYPHGGRKPWLAGLLSAAVPGLGKIYAGRAMDGLAVMIVMGFFGWQAWDGYAHDGPASVKGAVFALSGAGLYAGDIYGSVRAAGLENGKRRKAYGERVKFVAEFRLP